MAKQEFNDNDIALAWQKLADKISLNSQINKQEIMTAIKMESHSGIAELKRRVKYKLYWSVAFIVLFTTAMLFFMGNIDIVILLGIIVAAYVIGFIPMFLKYRQIEDGIPENGDILQSVRYNTAQIKSVLRLEKTWGMITFTPVILIAILGGSVLDGLTLTECFQDPRILTKGLIAIGVFTPLLIWVSHKMNKYAFGSHLKKLEENIVKMETLK
nr:hypothetical protein [Bacteroidota bacterium]